MTEKITEYKQLPILSSRSQSFMDEYEGEGEIPDDIRLEVIQYLKDNEPFVVEAKNRLEQYFAKIFNK